MWFLTLLGKLLVDLDPSLLDYECQSVCTLRILYALIWFRFPTRENENIPTDVTLNEIRRDDLLHNIWDSGIKIRRIAIAVKFLVLLIYLESYSNWFIHQAPCTLLPSLVDIHIHIANLPSCLANYIQVLVFGFNPHPSSNLVLRLTSTSSAIIHHYLTLNIIRGVRQISPASHPTWILLACYEWQSSTSHYIYTASSCQRWGSRCVQISSSLVCNPAIHPQDSTNLMSLCLYSASMLTVHF